MAVGMLKKEKKKNKGKQENYVVNGKNKDDIFFFGLKYSSLIFKCAKVTGQTIKVCKKKKKLKK